MDALCSFHCCTGRTETAQIDRADSHVWTWGVVPIEVSRMLIEMTSLLVVMYCLDFLVVVVVVFVICLSHSIQFAVLR